MLLYLKDVEYLQEYADRLRELGYKVREENYINTLDVADNRSNNIITRINTIEKEVEDDKGGKKATFDSVMAWMMTSGVVGLTEDITVSRYIEIKKNIIEQRKAA